MTALSIAMIILAYLGGSISSAILIARLYRLPDPRENGSHNPGTTNVLRLGGRSAALWVLLCDMAKGTIPVYLAWYFQLTPFVLGLIGIAACLGHMYPLFFQFRGGKGVATALGTMMPIGFAMGGMMLATWILVLLLTGYSSLAALIVPAGPALYLLAKAGIHPLGCHAQLSYHLSSPREHTAAAQWQGEPHLATQTKRQQTTPVS